MTGDFDAHFKWLGIRPDEQPPDHYRLLGIPAFIDDPDVIEHAADQRMSHVRSFQSGPHGEASQRILNELAAARHRLLDPTKKAAYDSQLRDLQRNVGGDIGLEPIAGGESEYRLQPLEPKLSGPIRMKGNRKKRKRRRVGALLSAAVAVAAVLVAAVLSLNWINDRSRSGLEQKPPATAAKPPQPSATTSTVPQSTTTQPETVSSAGSAARGGAAVETPAESQHTNDVVTTVHGIQLRLIPAGEFLMGSPAGDEKALSGEKPQHRVRISKPFYIGVHHVTQEQYQTVMETNPSQFAASGQRRSQVAGRDTSRFPVENVSWYDAIDFCNQLSQRERLGPYYAHNGNTVTILGGDGYRLPTEAEWEYACRAGSTTPFYFGSDPSDVPEHAWFKPNSNGTTHPVGEKKPNDWGLYDMYGNVWDWCWDQYDANHYSASSTVDPLGPAVGRGRVIRGGSCYLHIFRSASRNFGVGPQRRVADGGFRVICGTNRSFSTNRGEH